jgi:hypothetical protein
MERSEIRAKFSRDSPAFRFAPCRSQVLPAGAVEPEDRNDDNADPKKRIEDKWIDNPTFEPTVFKMSDEFIPLYLGEVVWLLSGHFVVRLENVHPFTQSTFGVKEQLRTPIK